MLVARSPVQQIIQSTIPKIIIQLCIFLAILRARLIDCSRASDAVNMLGTYDIPSPYYNDLSELRDTDLVFMGPQNFLDSRGSKNGPQYLDKLQQSLDYIPNDEDDGQFGQLDNRWEKYPAQNELPVRQQLQQSMSELPLSLEQANINGLEFLGEGPFGGTGRDNEINYNAVMRDEEHLPQSGLWGHQYMQGGAGEGTQRLSPTGMYKNLQEIKTDAFLPTYCDPPNPCPEGYTSDDNCLEGVKNTADFSREYQSQQDCLCDPEHMFDCPEDRTPFFLSSQLESAAAQTAASKMASGGPKSVEEFAKVMKSLEKKKKDHPVVAKKGKIMKKSEEHQKTNPSLQGEKLRRIAKKGMNMF